MLDCCRRIKVVHNASLSIDSLHLAIHGNPLIASNPEVEI